MNSITCNKILIRNPSTAVMVTAHSKVEFTHVDLFIALPKVSLTSPQRRTDFAAKQLKLVLLSCLRLPA